MIYAATYIKGYKESGFVGVFSSITNILNNIREDRDLDRATVLVWEERVDFPEDSGTTPVACFYQEDGQWVTTSQPEK